MPKSPSVKDQVLVILKSKEWVFVEDFEKVFPKKTPGHQSWPQRMRQLRTEGHTIIKRKKANCPNIWEYSLKNPTLHNSEAIDLGGFVEGKLANTPEVRANYPKTSLEPPSAKFREPAKDELSEMVSHGNLAQETAINRKAFETAQGQYAFLK